MGKQKIIELLGQTIPDDNILKDFSQYVKEIQPYRGERLQEFLKYLRKHVGKPSEEVLEKKRVYQQLFPSESYKESKINEFYTDFYKVLERYIITRRLDKMEFLKKLLKADGINSLGLEPKHLAALRKALKDDLPENEAVYYEYKQKSHQMVLDQLKSDDAPYHEQKEHLMLAYKYGEISSTIITFKYVCELITRKIGLGEEYEEGIGELIERQLAYIPFRDEVLVIDLLARSAFLLQDPNLKQYLELKELFYEAADKLYSENKAILLHLANALAFIKIENIHEEYFDLYKFGVEKEYFLEEDMMSAANFNNIVRIACQVNQVAWARNFIETHIQYLHTTDVELKDIEQLYSSFLLFAEKDFAKVIDQAKDIQSECLTFGLNKHNLVLKSTYELHKHTEQEEMARLIDAYKKYVNSKVKQEFLSKKFKNQIFNFLRMVGHLMNYPYKKATKEDLLSKVASYEGQIIDIAWLNEKIKTLKNY